MQEIYLCEYSVTYFILFFYCSINFHNPVLSKPANLQNSAVLRMLEEEEHRQRNGYAPSKLIFRKINDIFAKAYIYHCTIIVSIRENDKR